MMQEYSEIAFCMTGCKEGGNLSKEQAIVLGDSGYSLLDWLMTPTEVNLHDPAVIRYNRKHNCTRRIVENSLEILKERFPCLYYLRVEPIFACEISKCCVSVYNFARRVGLIGIDRDDDNANGMIEDDEENFGNDDEPSNVNGNLRLQNIINHFR